MISIDNKILAHILADHLQPLLHTIVKSDQSGFVPGRSTSHNLRTLFGPFHSLRLPLLLDATRHLIPSSGLTSSLCFAVSGSVLNSFN